MIAEDKKDDVRMLCATELQKCQAMFRDPSFVTLKLSSSSMKLVP